MALSPRTPRRPHRTVKPMNAECPFCAEHVEPDYKDIARLERFTTDRGKIVGRARSGICQKHQRRLAVAIKRARHLALLPFVPGVS